MKLFNRKSKKPGLPPGTLLYTGKPSNEKIEIHQILYGSEMISEKDMSEIEFDLFIEDQSKVNWINLNGLHQIDILKGIGEKYQIPNLVLEDILNQNQRPKIEEFDHGIFVVTKMIYWDKEKSEIHYEQVSLYLIDNTVISFQDRSGDVFEPVRNRIRENKGRIQKSGADYLLYALLDAMVDHYFLTVEYLGDQIESIEEDILGSSSNVTLNLLHQIRKQIILLRKSVIPLREGVLSINHNENKHIKKSTYPFLQDLYEHVIQIIDMLETMRDVNNGLFDLYISMVSNKTNDVMKVLTIIATIFIPITFIAGIYGMNFEWMPELQWKWGYLMIWSIMLFISFGMILYFKRKNWL